MSGRKRRALQQVGVAILLGGVATMARETFTLTMRVDNDAFDEVPASGIARIIRSVATRVGDGELRGWLHDANGNRVGEYRVEGEGRT